MKLHLHITPQGLHLLTQSTPFLRWMPINGRFCNLFWMKSFASFSILSDHRIYCWRPREFWWAGNGPGAPTKAKTGNLDEGYLWRKYLYKILVLSIIEQIFHKCIHLYMHVCTHSHYKILASTIWLIFYDGITDNYW